VISYAVRLDLSLQRYSFLTSQGSNQVKQVYFFSFVTRSATDGRCAP
jgi:hypothetical protein